ncbi:hemerythrin domain-containing protein [Roseinatronobacter monicus]|uniref:Hemerythrin HHE cation binding domain-containing protein n=1 Tax=Roseinatronobacter monicus TaxID=393481 RepID=A0A543KDE5_9RHOB|nr:hemerythrin domain-containing protein [Roseinatronobacter monicus]TQM93057.1 hemerythrin HHE cation binding domain-containing protein [Roseinatronobacter monicus]
MFETDLGRRDRLPDALRVLLEKYPRNMWESHRNFDGLTRFWLERHLMFRKALKQWQGDTRGFLDKGRDPRAHGQLTGRIGGFLINELHGHHQIEDAHYFPVLSASEKRLSHGFELLDNDHHALDAQLAGLTKAANTHLRALQNRNADAKASAGKMLTQLDGFERFLNRHLIDEEELVVPVILHHALKF